ncbi:expressed unknown protein [Seminavis robusta]|uniref:Uncharacterized protein n=1 Tax=Seminavis robusta TaxID=568900 RepID=A0A9N8HE37_9STRA|nr:expressed unknown protein [Seminavis robusta]|eukprot:Sro286_g108190.1 n/a (98) ;mRNA; f:1684-1977
MGVQDVKTIQKAAAEAFLQYRLEEMDAKLDAIGQQLEGMDQTLQSQWERVEAHGRDLETVQAHVQELQVKMQRHAQAAKKYRVPRKNNVASESEEAS